MNVSRRNILSLVLLFGEILSEIDSAQHRHVHKHKHIHNHRKDFSTQNMRTNTTTQTSNDISSFGHIHFNKSQATQLDKNNDTVKDVTTRSTEKPIVINNTKFYATTGKQGQSPNWKKNTKGFRFSDTVAGDNIVRQHAAKTVRLNCLVKGLSDKKYLSVKWFKDGKNIKANIER